ncbi:hypothetical protein [Puia dinghuensis]|uniref:DoxX family protein n=1 Tax=Puia dinghuensis TaxID=1792502 RepID=A0A8J2XUA1_9BACT|nr:hypothetical protein [Puia dinghuensis]GGB08938.1 hypothetical protein GCM10011511_35580 [Puia dinghuensis]
MKVFSGDGLQQPAQPIHSTLRIASAMCFIGHGAFGIITKPIWCNYFAVFGIGHDLAYRLMPLVGIIDILMGLSLLFYPIRAIAAWLVGWGLLTAALRPLSGEPFAEIIERAGNYCAPLALLLLSEKGGLGSRLSPDPRIDARRFRLVTFCLRLAVFFLLSGHGWLNLIEKKGLLQQYAGLGFPDPAHTAHLVGMFELLAALAVLVRPVRPLVLVFFVWKMGIELFYPQHEVFEWIERGGSYGCLLALWMALGQTPALTGSQTKEKITLTI